MPTPIRWSPPIPLSPAEAAVAQHLHRNGKFYVFLREIRAELFDEAFQAELAAAYAPRGTAPLPAALLAMVTLLQAYDQVSDVEAVTTAQMDRRWQLVLDTLGASRAPFSQGALVKFRARLIAHDLDRKLLDRTVALAKQTGRFGWQHLRAALDSSPLIGAGRVQDTWNLLGRALATVATCAAKAVGVPRAQVLREAGVTLLAAPSLKAALDIDWDDPVAQAAALTRLLAEVDRLEQWVITHADAPAAQPALAAALAALHRVLAQDLEPDPTSGCRGLRQGVAGDRMPSLGDPEMRHGRKTRTRPFNGYKRHALTVLGPDLILDALVRPANEPEHLTLATLAPAVEAHGPLAELFIDRGYLASPTVATLHAGGTAIRAKAWTSHNGGRYPKHAFTIDLARGASRVRPSTRRGFARARGAPTSPPPPVARVSATRPAPPEPAGGPSRCIPRNPCSKTYGPRCATPRGARSSANGRRSNTPLHASITFKGRGPATKVCARIPSTYAGAPRSPISSNCGD